MLPRTSPRRAHKMDEVKRIVREGFVLSTPDFWSRSFHQVIGEEDDYWKPGDGLQEELGDG